MLFRSEHRTINAPYRLTFAVLQLKFSNSPQSFNVVLDTGSSDLWVTGPDCTTCGRGTPSFNSGASSTFQAAQSNGQPVLVGILYVTGAVVGAVAGDLVRDTVAMGGFQVQRQPWVLVNQTSGNLLDGSMAGIMGLGFDTGASTGATPFWQTLAMNNQLTTPEMSFWFTRLLDDPTAQEEEFGGIFTLGGQNKTLYTGDVEFLSLATNAGLKTSWFLNVSGMFLIYACFTHGFFSRMPPDLGITVNKKNVILLSGGVAAIDTGTTLIGGPMAAVSAIWAQIPNSLPLGGNLTGFYGFRMPVLC